MKRKSAAILFFIPVCFCLASCGEKTGQTATAPGSSETTAVTRAAATTMRAAETETTTVPETSTAPYSRETTGTVSSTVSGKAGIPRTVSEIVDTFNAAVNRTKAEKPGYTLTVINRTDKEKINIADNKALNAVVPGIVASAINAKANDITVTVNRGAPHNDFPPKGSNPAALAAGSVQSAVLADKGNCYDVVITMKDERLGSLPADEHQTKHGKAFNMISLGEFRAFTGKIPGVEITSFTPVYNGSTIRCEIDKKTGTLKKATYRLNTFAAADITVLHSGRLRFTAELEYTVQEEYIIG